MQNESSTKENGQQKSVIERKGYGDIQMHNSYEKCNEDLTGEIVIYNEKRLLKLPLSLSAESDISPWMLKRDAHLRVLSKKEPEISRLLYTDDGKLVRVFENRDENKEITSVRFEEYERKGFYLIKDLLGISKPINSFEMSIYKENEDLKGEDLFRYFNILHFQKDCDMKFDKEKVKAIREKELSRAKHPAGVLSSFEEWESQTEIFGRRTPQTDKAVSLEQE